MTAFDTAAAVLFSNPDRGEDGTLRPVAGGGYAVRCFYSRPDPVLDLGPVGARNPGVRIDCELNGTTPLPLKGDAIDVAGRGSFTIVSVERAPLGGWVVLDVNPVP